jgi:hypothetical protein
MGVFTGESGGSLALPFAGMTQIRFNGYYLRLLATPAKTASRLGEAGSGVKGEARMERGRGQAPMQQFRPAALAL